MRAGFYWRRQRCRQHILFADLVAMPEVPHPIPSRTRSLSPPGPMVLRLKARESRSRPGLPRGCSVKPTLHHDNASSAFDAGWSSPVARQAHNLKVTGSNPVPAPSLRTRQVNDLAGFSCLTVMQGHRLGRHRSLAVPQRRAVRSGRGSRTARTRPRSAPRRARAPR